MTGCETAWAASGSRRRVGRNDEVAFGNIGKLPTGHQVSNASAFLHIANNHLGHELAVPADEQLAIR